MKNLHSSPSYPAKFWVGQGREGGGAKDERVSLTEGRESMSTTCYFSVIFRLYLHRMWSDFLCSNKRFMKLLFSRLTDWIFHDSHARSMLRMVLEITPRINPVFSDLRYPIRCGEFGHVDVPSGIPSFYTKTFGQHAMCTWHYSRETG